MFATNAVELSARRKVAILATCCLSLFIVTMDSTIVNVALPSIRSALGASVSQLQWIVDVYTLVLASLLILAGASADRWGRRRVFQIGLVVFALGSLLCSLAPSIEVLIGARALQAVGGSMLNPVALSIITQAFVKPAERARAIGVWGAIVGVSMALGPIVGGILIQAVDWRAVFWVNLPICLLAIVLTALIVPESRSAAARAFDPLGQVLAILVLAGLVYGLIEGPVAGWAAPQTLLVFAVALVALLAFLAWERRREHPFLDLRFFGSAPFSAATLVAVAAFASWGAFLFLFSLYLQQVRGLSAFATGCVLVAPALAMLICSPLSGRAVARWGARPSLLLAGAALLVSAVLMLLIDADTPIPAIIAIITVFGFGFGMINAPITNSAVSGMPRDRAGAASAIASTSRQVGMSLGVALAGSVTGVAVTGVDAGFPQAMHAMWGWVIGFAVAILALAVVSTSRWGRATAESVARRLIQEEAVDAR
ncbi:MFS transporter [Microbacterium sp. SORGH_AS_0888]|uniref:MFS transporter n=1 Tax=Microbacterium sp. SORGH_AS_0888 TaxID=3041791 RepID=UPI002789C86F|nr:MFS transporter [Microbacterium sp. SORGH_AS_0888]MDQ1129790.1 EmrB/QacA subfamily drug resistance transporter [Microbacterium sp. SORGH_AS_0888]